MDVLDLNDYDPKNNAKHRFLLAVTDNVCKFGWRVPLKSNRAQTVNDSFENILNSSKRKPKLNETDDGEEFVHKIFFEFVI